MAYLILLALGALDAAGYSVIAPIAPEIAERTGAGPGTIGALTGAFAVGMAAGFWLGGSVVRRRGATPALALALVAVAVGCAGFVGFEGLGVWFPARILMGVGSGGLWIGIVFATLERFPGEEYRRLTGVLGAYAIGTIAGPSFGALGGVQAPFAAFLAATLAVLVAVFALPAAHDRPRFGSDRAALRTPGFRLASVSVLAVAAGVGVVDGPLPLHFGTRLEQAEIAALYVAAAFVVGGASVAAGHLRPRPLVPVSALLVLAGTGAAVATDDVWLWVPALAVIALGLGLGEACALGVLLESVGAERIVVALVVWSQMWSIGYLVGPVAGGALAEGLGFGSLVAVPAFACALVLVTLKASPPVPAAPGGA